MNRERTPVFHALPSGMDIAHWFKDQQHFQNVGGDATWLCADPHQWLWHLATVDHDDQVFWLLAIGGTESQDMLFVTSGLRCSLACEWRNKPSEQQDWGYGPLVWMAGLVEEYEAGWTSTIQRGDGATEQEEGRGDPADPGSTDRPGDGVPHRQAR